jgi:hypothetical protein
VTKIRCPALGHGRCQHVRGKADALARCGEHAVGSGAVVEIGNRGADGVAVGFVAPDGGVDLAGELVGVGEFA